jgi:RNA polymerase sigma-70 factor (ECF subfamily)
MHTDVPADVTRILNDLDSKDRQAVASLLPVVYADLRRLADSFFRRERNDHTLQPTALVHEAYLRLMGRRDGKFESREHFFRVAAVVMRHILVRHARDRGRLKRGGDVERVPFDEAQAAAPGGLPDVDLIALDEALTRLANVDPRQSRIVELRFFAGLSAAETAEVLGVSKRTVEDDWALAKAWLWREMNR